MSILNTTFNDSDGNGRITLYVNPFKNGSQFYGRFERNTITTETLIARIQKRKAGTNELAVQQIAGFLKQEILEALEKGEAVNVMDLGTLYIVPNGKFNGTNFEPDEKSPLLVKFTPSRITRGTVERINIKEIRIAENSPVITDVTDLYTGKKDLTLTAGRTALIEGQRLKLGGEEGGIFLCPADEKGNAVQTEDEWLKCPVVTRNTAKSAEFYIPDDAEGKYRIFFRSFYSNGISLCKSAKEALSDVVTVIK